MRRRSRRWKSGKAERTKGEEDKEEKMMRKEKEGKVGMY